MARQIVVIGLGRFGRSVALTLAEAGVEVLAIDRDLELVEEIADRVSAAVAFDATSADQLRAYAVEQMDAAVVAIGEDFEATVLITALLHQMSVAQIVARAYDATQHRILSMIGAHEVLNPEEEMGVRAAQGLLRHDVMDFIDLPEGYEVRQHVVEERQDGLSLGELRQACDEEILILQLTRRGQGEAESEEDPAEQLHRLPIPTDDNVIVVGDTLSLVGSSLALDRI
jgi:trk/ktr system potassium uptake protein